MDLKVEPGETFTTAAIVPIGAKRARKEICRMMENSNHYPAAMPKKWLDDLAGFEFTRWPHDPKPLNCKALPQLSLKQFQREQ